MTQVIQRKYRILSISLVLLLAFPFHFTANGQDGTTKIAVTNKSISIEAGGIYYGFRDEISSDLFYEGIGGTHLALGLHRNKNNTVFDAISLAFEYGQTGAKVNNEDDFAEIYSVSVAYSKIGIISSKKNNRIDYYFGGSASFNGLYIAYPLLFSNNGDAYSIDLVSFSPIAGMSFLLTDGQGKFPHSKIKLFTHVQLLGLNSRPNSFSGVAPEKITDEMNITSIHNNLHIKNTLSYEMMTKKNRQFDFSYNWLFIRNASRVNSLSYAQHNVSFRYYFNLKTRSK